MAARAQHTIYVHERGIQLAEIKRENRRLLAKASEEVVEGQLWL